MVLPTSQPKVAADPVAALDNVRFYVISTFFEDAGNRARSVATCNTQLCFDANSSFDRIEISQQYCDTLGGDVPARRELWIDGCVRRWEDQSGYVPGAFDPPEWVTGRDFGQDDLEKPGFVLDCVNGHPCVRGAPCLVDGPGNCTAPFAQNTSLEIELGQEFTMTGAFSAITVVRPVEQSADYHLFGLRGLQHVVADDSLVWVFQRFPEPVVTVPGVFIPDEWHLVEVYRDATGDITAYVDGEDVTPPSVPSSLEDTFALDYMSRTKGIDAMFGDLAVVLMVDDLLTPQEQADVRRWFETLYALDVLFEDDFESGGTSSWTHVP